MQQKIDRKTLLLWIGGGVAAILLTLMFLLSQFTNGNASADGESEPTAAPAPSASTDPTLIDQEGAPIGNQDEEGAPPTGMYQNDYSGDDGYERLPEGYDPTTSGTTGTIYDEVWAQGTLQRLSCELSTKRTATPQAIQPMVDFQADLGIAPYGSAAYMSQQVERWISYFRLNDGQRVDASMSAELEANCEFVDSSHGHDTPVGTEHFEGDGHDHGDESLEP